MKKKKNILANNKGSGRKLKLLSFILLWKRVPKQISHSALENCVMLQMDEIFS